MPYVCNCTRLSDLSSKKTATSLSKRSVSHKLKKMKLYKALVRPVVVYGSECWVLTENIKQKLLVFERKLLRRIFGPTQKANGDWRLKTNDELE